MKLIPSFGCLILCFNIGFAQLIDTNCIKSKPLYKNLPENNIRIDSINIGDFQNLLDKLVDKMITGRSLSLLEDYQLLMVMNTSCWAKFDKQDSVIALFQSIHIIEDEFDEIYGKGLDCKYTTYLGRGGALYYEELNTYLFGIPFICSRYIIK